MDGERLPTRQVFVLHGISTGGALGVKVPQLPTTPAGAIAALPGQAQSPLTDTGLHGRPVFVWRPMADIEKMASRPRDYLSEPGLPLLTGGLIFLILGGRRFDSAVASPYHSWLHRATCRLTQKFALVVPVGERDLAGPGVRPFPLGK